MWAHAREFIGCLGAEATPLLSSCPIALGTEMCNPPPEYFIECLGQFNIRHAMTTACIRRY